MASAHVARRRLHRQVAHDLKQVILDHVADDAGLFVELAAALDAEGFRHGDLHVLDVVTIPDRLEKRVGEAEDTGCSAPPPCQGSDRCGRSAAPSEDVVQRRVQLARRLQVAAERLLDDDARAAPAQPGGGQVLDDDGEHGRRNGEVVQRAARRYRAPARSRVEGGRVVVVAVDVAEQRRPAVSNASVVDARRARRCSSRARSISCSTRPARSRDADDRDVELAATRQRLQRGKDLLVRQVAGDAEEDERVAAARRSGSLLLRVATEAEAHRREHLVLEVA